MYSHDLEVLSTAEKVLKFVNQHTESRDWRVAAARLDAILDRRSHERLYESRSGVFIELSFGMLKYVEECDYHF